jgi:mono/diheme cytochrome c family protein
MLPLPRRPIATALTLMLLSGAIPAVAEEDAVTRGEYLVHAGGCFSCHTVAGGEKLAGGRALATPFGTFYSPNITPDPETGIGRWTDAQFLRALREGVRPDGANYFPVFPYPSFTSITDGDALAIKAYNAALGETQRLAFTQWVDADAIERWLQALPDSGNSGDIYARLRVPGNPPSNLAHGQPNWS